MPNITICRNPFRPQLDRDEVRARVGTRLDTVLRSNGLIAGRGRRMVREHAFVVQVNGAWLLESQWARRLAADDVVVVALLPAGGGGGSNPLQVVALVALAAATAGIGAWAAGAYATAAGVAATSTAALMVGAGASALVAIGGGMLLSAIFPPAKPPATMAREQASPTYTIGAQGNTARLMESIPVQYGRFRVYPDFAAQPYTELDSNQAYLYQLFCLGQGEYDIEEIRVEDTPIENFEEVEYEVIPPGGEVTLFPDNVVTSNAVQGIELKGPNEEGHATVGPFVANPAGSKANQLAVDIVLPSGLFYANDRGGSDERSVSWTVVAHPIDDDGAPAGSPVTLGAETFQAATNQPQMMTYRYDVPEGRYSVSVVRTSSKDADQRAANTLQWGGLRAYLPSKRDYGNLTLLAVVMRATNNLNQNTARRINVISTRKLQTWDPVNGWSVDPVATRNPAWALADVCRNPLYGRGLPDSRINLAALYRLAGIWAAREDTYDGVFDTTSTLWAALTQIARVGRAMPMYYSGVIDFIRNEPKTVKTQMFTPANIVSNTFSVDYAFPEHDSPDHVVVEYINEETWQPDEVVCALPGSQMLRPFRLQIPGIVSREQAWREGISLAAQNRDQRRFVSFQTEMEGRIPRYGDLVEISHDVPAWGLTGWIEEYDPDTKTLTTSEPLQWWSGENHYINLRRRDGAPDGPYRVVAGAHDREMVIADAIDGHGIYVSDGQGETFTTYQFGPGERRSLLAQVMSATPDDSDHVTLECVNYALSVHIAETGGAVPPPNAASLLPMTPNAPVVDRVTVYASSVPGEQVVSATPARGADRYEFRASNDLGASWIDLGAHLNASIITRLQAGLWQVQARGIGTMHGPWVTWSGLVSATMVPPPSLVSLTATPLVMGIQWDWVLPDAPWMRSVEIWASPTPNMGDASLLGEFRQQQRTYTQYGLVHGQNFWAWARIIDDGDQAGAWYPPESGPGVHGQSSTDTTAIQGYITQQIVTSALGAILMADIESIPGIQAEIADLPQIRNALDDIPDIQAEIADLPDIRAILAQHGIDIDQIDDAISSLEAQLADLAGAPDWDNATAYLTGQIVKDGGALYRAKINVPAGTPTSNATYWEKIGDYGSLGEAVSALLVRMLNVETTLDEVTGDIIAMSQEILALQADLLALDGTVQGQAAAIQTLETEVSEVDGKVTAQARETSMIRAQLRDEDDGEGRLADVLAQHGSNTRITETREVIATNERAQATINQQMLGQIAGNTASIDDLSQVVATNDQTTATRFSQLEADLGAVEDDATGNAQAISLVQADVSRIDGEVQAQATDISELTSTVSVVDGKAVAAQNSADAAALAAAEAAGIAGGKGKVLIQPAEPAVEDRLPQNLWIDTTSGANTPKRWSGSAWVAVTDKAAVDAADAAAAAQADATNALQGVASNSAQITTLSQTVADNESAQAMVNSTLTASVGAAQSAADDAAAAAQDASDLAGGKGKVFFQATAPDAVDRQPQNLWIDTTGNANTPKRWDGTAWVAVTDKAATDALAAAAAAQSAANANTAAIQTISDTVATDKAAQATINSTLQTQVGDVETSVQAISTNVTDITGKFNAAQAVKLAVNSGGTTYTAGYGIGLSNETGVTQSQFVVVADRFSVMHNINGTPVSVFAVQGGVAILNNAIIGNATIGAAKLSDWLESDAVGPGGVPVLRLNFRTGEIELNSPAAGGGRMALNNRLIQIFDGNNVLRVRMGIW